MGYNKDIYEKAKTILSERRNRALSDAENRKNIFYGKYPEAEKIDYILSSTAIKAGKAVLSGKDAKTELEKLKKENLALQNRLEEIYKSAGIDSSYLQVKYNCPKCRDTGYIDGKMCDCMKQLLRETAYAQLNSLSPLSLSTFDSFSLDYYSDSPIDNSTVIPKDRMSKILKFCREYANNFGKGSKSLLMCGTTGLGKTHLSLAIANEVIEKGYGVIYCSAPNILTKLQNEHFSRNKNEESDTEEYLTDCDLLIIDDLGTEFITQFTSSAIYNILNTRIMTAKPTIISTNMSIRELEKSYSQRFVSRIMGESIKLDFAGRDIRQIKAMMR